MFRRSVILIGAVLLILTMAASAIQAVALSDRVIQQKKDDGTFDAYVERLRELRAQGMDQPDKSLLSNNLALGVNEPAVYKILVILVDFPDKPAAAGFANTTVGDFDSLLFSDGLNPTGSMKEFYYENSYGNYIIDGDVVGWYHAPFDHDEYNYGAFNPAELVKWAVFEADDDVDYTQYDNDGDGSVDGIILVHSGTGYEESHNSTEIHSHMSYMGLTAVDGIWANAYTIQPEESYNSKSMSAIGVFCHEWGHVLDLPDLYDYDGSSQGVGRWSLMGSGNYNNASQTPAHFDAWCKSKLGWLQLIRVMSNIEAAEIPAVEHTPVAYRLNRNGTLSSEYWVVENRYNTGFDAALPAHGLMIYHIDEDEMNNNNEWHPLVFIEQADGKFDLQGPYNRGDGGDPWPWEQARNFHDKTTPGSKHYVSTSSQVGVWNISPRDSVMTADLEVAFSRPWVELQAMVLSDNAYGNNNGVPEASEKIQLILALVNDWAEAADISVTMTTDDPTLGVVVGTSNFPTLAMGQTVSNNDSPFEFQIPAVYESRIDSFYFEVTANGSTYQISLGAEANVGRPQLLIVDDDNGDPGQFEEYLAWPLYNKRIPAATWKTYLSGSPEISDLNEYHIVMWVTGNYRNYLLSQPDVAVMKGYMSSGGNLFLTGQGLAQQLTVQDPYFLHDYLKAEYHDSTYTFIPVLSATDGPVSVDMNSIVIFGNSGASNQTVYNHILPINGGVAEWEYLNGPGKPINYGAVSYSGNYKSVFFTFGFEAIESDDSRFETQATVLARIIDFFGDIPTDVGDPNGMAINLPARFTLNQNYPNPFNPVTTISYNITGVGPRIDRTILNIFNILGQHVRTLVDRDEVPGQYSVNWDGKDDLAQEVASGLYFYRLTRGEQVESRKMILIK